MATFSSAACAQCSKPRRVGKDQAQLFTTENIYVHVRLVNSFHSFMIVRSFTHTRTITNFQMKRELVSIQSKLPQYAKGHGPKKIHHPTTVATNTPCKDEQQDPELQDATATEEKKADDTKNASRKPRAKASPNVTPSTSCARAFKSKRETLVTCQGVPVLIEEFDVSQSQEVTWMTAKPTKCSSVRKNNKNNLHEN